MYQALVDLASLIVSHAGLAGVILIFWMIDRYFLVRDLKSVNEKVLVMVEKNTVAFVEMKAAIRELGKSIDNLCSRI